MIDIIIPAYNAHETIYKTLSNIAIQTIKDKAIVYIVDDCSKKNYNEEVSFFKDSLKIVQLKTKKNCGPGLSRQLALEKSNSQYIIFMDADDQFYNPFSLELLYKEITKNNLDLVIALELFEDKGYIIPNEGSLHGQIFRRSHINKYKIKFNDTRYSEDNSFHNLFKITSGNYKILDKITYIYCYNPNSITAGDDKKIIILSGYIYNMLWLTDELEKRKFDWHTIVDKLAASYVHVYREIKIDPETDYSEIYKLPYNIELYFQKYEQNAECKKYLSDEYMAGHILTQLECNNMYKKYAVEEFKNFRKRFIPKDDSND